MLDWRDYLVSDEKKNLKWTINFLSGGLGLHYDF